MPAFEASYYMKGENNLYILVFELFAAVDVILYIFQQSSFWQSNVYCCIQLFLNYNNKGHNCTNLFFTNNNKKG